MPNQPPTPTRLSQRTASQLAPVVSVFCLAYNHERFLRRCLNGFLEQITTFPVEIVVHDDASTDGTAAILQEYETRYPGVIRSIRQKENQHSQGRSPLILIDQFCHGEFVAWCEGDDYWTDPQKLELQVAYLRANPDCSGCFHDALLVDADGRTLRESYFHTDQEKFAQADVLDSLLSREPTCSLCFRRAAFAPLPAWFSLRPCDLFLDIHLTSQGKLGFINRNMGAYRRHSGGIWSGEREAHQIVELVYRYKLLVNEPAFAPYRDLLLRKIAEFQASLFTRNDADIELGRLENVVAEQRALIATVRKENDRLDAETRQARAAEQAAVANAQVHIDRLREQLEQLAATARDQTTHIARLTAERDRSAGETQQARAAEQAALTQAQSQLDDLLAQLNRLARTSEEQDGYIAVLQRDRDRLAAENAVLAANSARHLAVIDEQTRYIATLKAQIEHKPSP